MGRDIEMALMGLDIGTTGCKASVFDTGGTVLASASREYGVEFPHPSWAEQNLEAVWISAREAIAEAAAASDSTIDGIALSVHGEAVVPVDARGRALRPAILGMDTRTGEQNDHLRERFGERELFLQTGMPVHTVNTLPKLMWLKEHEPETWTNAERFLLVEDFLVSKMTGRSAISHCLASRTQLYDTRAGTWANDILEYLGLDPTRLSDLTPSGTAVDVMSADLARSLGLSSQPTVAAGGHDQACGALGVGLVEPGRAMVSTGTAEVVELALAEPVLNDTLYRGNVSVYGHPDGERYLAMTLNQSGGFVLRWFRDAFCPDLVERAAREGHDAYSLLLDDAPAGPTCLLLLPHLSGSGTPLLDTRSRGAIVGLTFSTTRSETAKAILEGLTYELRVNLDLLARSGAEISELRAIGGGAKSDVWLQLKADITGLPVLKPRVTEAAGWGAAILAGCATGAFEDASSAAEASVVLERTFAPNPGPASLYAEKYAEYEKLYPALRDVLHAL